VSHCGKQENGFLLARYHDILAHVALLLARVAVDVRDRIAEISV